MPYSSLLHPAIPKSAAPRSPTPVAVHCCPIPSQETLKQFCLSLYGIFGSQCAQGLFEPSEPVCQVWGLILNEISPLLSSCWGFSFVLCSGVHKFLFVAPKSLFPQSCVNSGSSIVGLMETSSKRAYAICRSAAPRVPVPVTGHC